MDRSEITQRVEKVVGQVLKVDPKDLKLESNFAFDLGADSMSSVALVAAFEEEFGVELDQEAALAVQTVTSAVDFLKAILDR